MAGEKRVVNAAAAGLVMFMFVDGNFDLAGFGSLIFTVALWGAAGLAVAECMVLARSGAGRRGALMAAMRGARGRVALLVAAQFAMLGISLALPESGILRGLTVFYLLAALVLPMLWGAGVVRQQTLGWPLAPPGWLRQYRWRIFAALMLMGMTLSALMLMMTPVVPGQAVQDLMPEEESAGLTAMVLALWLMVNAPWLEEIVFRHYLLPRFTLWFGGGRVACVLAVVVLAAVFAVGHAGHLEPAWPKLMQTFGWGLLFGVARVWFGSGWAISLHLGLNLSSIAFVPFFT